MAQTKPNFIHCGHFESAPARFLNAADRHRFRPSIQDCGLKMVGQGNIARDFTQTSHALKQKSHISGTCKQKACREGLRFTKTGGMNAS
jgi:hypothetical protein